MRSWRSVVLVLAACLIVASLAACGGDDDASPSSGDGSSSANTIPVSAGPFVFDYPASWKRLDVHLIGPLDDPDLAVLYYTELTSFTACPANATRKSEKTSSGLSATVCSGSNAPYYRGVQERYTEWVITCPQGSSCAPGVYSFSFGGSPEFHDRYRSQFDQLAKSIRVK